MQYPSCLTFAVCFVSSEAFNMGHRSPPQDFTKPNSRSNERKVATSPRLSFSFREQQKALKSTLHISQKKMIELEYKTSMNTHQLCNALEWYTEEYPLYFHGKHTPEPLASVCNNLSLVTCISGKCKWQVRYSVLYHKRALNNYIIPCHRKIQ